jgi:hypothetical protein
MGGVEPGMVAVAGSSAGAGPVGGDIRTIALVPITASNAGIFQPTTMGGWMNLATGLLAVDGETTDKPQLAGAAQYTPAVECISSHFGFSPGHVGGTGFALRMRENLKPRFEAALLDAGKPAKAKEVISSFVSKGFGEVRFDALAEAGLVTHEAASGYLQRVRDAARTALTDELERTVTSQRRYRVASIAGFVSMVIGVLACIGFLGVPTLLDPETASYVKISIQPSGIFGSLVWLGLSTFFVKGCSGEGDSLAKLLRNAMNAQAAADDQLTRLLGKV